MSPILLPNRIAAIAPGVPSPFPSGETKSREYLLNATCVTLNLIFMAQLDRLEPDCIHLNPIQEKYREQVRKTW